MGRHREQDAQSGTWWCSFLLAMNGAKALFRALLWCMQDSADQEK